MQCEYLFVYGSLRKAAEHPMHAVLLQYTDYYADGYLQGELYQVNGYPGAVESAAPTAKVFGELYQILDPQSLLEQLDRYEECSPDDPLPHEYCRKILFVVSAAGDTVTTWVYVYNADVSRLQKITSGDYCAAA